MDELSVRQVFRQTADRPVVCTQQAGQGYCLPYGSKLNCKVYYNMYDDLGYYTKKPKWVESDVLCL